ncbi:hypothetical protein GCM10023238_17080 [Streptomyces heliomycini]
MERETHTTDNGPLIVDEYQVTALDTGEQHTVHLAGDVVLAAPASNWKTSIHHRRSSTDRRLSKAPTPAGRTPVDGRSADDSSCGGTARSPRTAAP